MAFLPLALLGGALIVFLVSTRQWPLAIRGPIWLTGLGMLIAAGVLALNRGDHYGLIQMTIDAARAGAKGRSALAEEVTANWDNLADKLNPTFDLLLLATGGLALLALAAFTPGERLEAAVRALAPVGLGVILGSLLSLTVVALGLDGYQKERVYAARPGAVEAIDGDTLRMGGISLRLWGIDAPEYDSAAKQSNAHNQYCRAPSGPTRCGAEARDYLAGLIKNRMIVCAGPRGDRAFARKLSEAFGRPLVQCAAYNAQGSFDLAAKMVEAGYADLYRTKDAIDSCYTAEAEAAAAAHAGLWHNGFLPPYLWRNDEEARANYMKTGQVPPRPRALQKDCSSNRHIL